MTPTVRLTSMRKIKYSKSVESFFQIHWQRNKGYWKLYKSISKKKKGFIGSWRIWEIAFKYVFQCGNTWAYMARVSWIIRHCVLHREFKASLGNLDKLLSLVKHIGGSNFSPYHCGEEGSKQY